MDLTDFILDLYQMFLISQLTIGFSTSFFGASFSSIMESISNFLTTLSNSTITDISATIVNLSNIPIILAALFFKIYKLYCSIKDFFLGRNRSVCKKHHYNNADHRSPSDYNDDEPYDRFDDIENTHFIDQRHNTTDYEGFERRKNND